MGVPFLLPFPSLVSRTARGTQLGPLRPFAPAALQPCGPALQPLPSPAPGEVPQVPNLLPWSLHQVLQPSPPCTHVGSIFQFFTGLPSFVDGVSRRWIGGFSFSGAAQGAPAAAPPAAARALFRAVSRDRNSRVSPPPRCASAPPNMGAAPPPPSGLRAARQRPQERRQGSGRRPTDEEFLHASIAHFQ